MIRTPIALLGFQFVITVMFGMLSFGLQGQNFYKENKPKTLSVLVGLGAGTFFAAPRPLTDSLINQIMPVLSLGVEKKIGSHFGLKSIVNFQAYGKKEFVINESGEGKNIPLYQGISYAFELTPTFNLIPHHHHFNRPKVNFNLGVGIGYLATYRAEKFTFQEKTYTFNFLEHSAFAPIRSSLIFKADSWSDLAIEGVFFYTWLKKSNNMDFKKYGDHFGQVNLVYRRLIK